MIRTVIAAPNGMVVVDREQAGSADSPVEDTERRQFWAEFLDPLTFDDPEQRKANATNQGAIYFPLPGGVWLTVFRNVTKREVGLFLSYTRGSQGERIVQRIISDWDAVQPELGGSALIWVDHAGEKSAGSPRTLIIDKLETGSLADPKERDHAFDWLRRRTNEFVNVLRPRVRAAAADLDLEAR
jgi:hypothetical protein